MAIAGPCRVSHRVHPRANPNNAVPYIFTPPLHLGRPLRAAARIKNRSVHCGGGLVESNRSRASNVALTVTIVDWAGQHSAAAGHERAYIAAAARGPSSSRMQHLSPSHSSVGVATERASGTHRPGGLGMVWSGLVISSLGLV